MQTTAGEAAVSKARRCDRHARSKHARATVAADSAQQDGKGGGRREKNATVTGCSTPHKRALVCAEPISRQRQSNATSCESQVDMSARRFVGGPAAGPREKRAKHKGCAASSLSSSTRTEAQAAMHAAHRSVRAWPPPAMLGGVGCVVTMPCRIKSKLGNCCRVDACAARMSRGWQMHTSSSACRKCPHAFSCMRTASKAHHPSALAGRCTRAGCVHTQHNAVRAGCSCTAALPAIAETPVARNSTTKAAGALLSETTNK